MRTELFGQVRTAVRSRLPLSRPQIGAALLVVRRLAEGVGDIRMFSLREGHTYELAEYIDLQVCCMFVALVCCAS